MNNNISKHIHESQKNESDNRRNKLAKILPKMVDCKYLAEMENLSLRQLRKQSKEVKNILKYIEGLELSKHALSKKRILLSNINKINFVLNSLLNNNQFAATNLWDCSTDHFKLIAAIYVALKEISSRLIKQDKNVISNPIHKQFVFVSSEIGLRLYSLYVDDRKDGDIVFT